MTISTLIEYLKQFPSDAVVEFHQWDYDHEEYKTVHMLEEMRFDPNTKKLII